MIGGLLGAALIAVVAVLAGNFNDTFARALFTLLLVMIHALVCLAFLEKTVKSQVANSKFFENTVFFIIVLSFFTSILGVWEIFPGELVGKLYLSYFVFLFACLHGLMLTETRGKESRIDNIVNINYVLMAIVILMLLPIIWFSSDSFDSFYFRLLAAFGIVDATMTILAVILHRLYIQKHPEAPSTIFSVTTKLDPNGNPVPVQAQVQKRHIHPLIWLLGIFIVGQFVISLLFAAFGAFYANN